MRKLLFREPLLSSILIIIMVINAVGYFWLLWWEKTWLNNLIEINNVPPRVILITTIALSINIIIASLQHYAIINLPIIIINKIKKKNFEKSEIFRNKNISLEEKYYSFYEKLSEESLKPLFQMFYQASFLLLSILWAWTISWWISISMIFFYFITSVPIIIYGKKIIPLEKENHLANLKYDSKIQKFFSWNNIMNSLDLSEKNEKIINNLTSKQMKPSFRLKKCDNYIELLQDLINGMVVISSILICYFLVENSTIKIGDSIVFISIVSFIIFFAGGFLYNFVRMRGSLLIVKEYIDIKFKQQNNKNNYSNKIIANKNDKTFVFKKNKNYLIKGKSGSGKTYLARSLARLDEGEWNINGNNSIIYLTTEDSSFFGEIKNVLRYFLSEEKALMSEVKLREFGIDINKRAEELSLGQQQILKIFISLKMEADFIILDDIFKNIHTILRKKIIKNVGVRKGIIFISHNIQEFNVDVKYTLGVKLLGGNKPHK